MTEKKRTKKIPPDQADELVLTELEQVRVLADPLRLRIVEQLCQEESTTKQVAESLGEKPTKLYHHVEALEKVGLIRQTRTRRNRGTLERYYLAVARKFKADASLFSEPAAAGDTETLRSMVSTIVETTGRELENLANHAGGELLASAHAFRGINRLGHSAIVLRTSVLLEHGQQFFR